MAISVDATVLGTLKSVASAAGVSVEGGLTVDVLTVNHGLGAVPDYVTSQLRSSSSSGPSGGAPALAITSFNASVVNCIFTPTSGQAAAAMSAQFDVISEITHSIVR